MEREELLKRLVLSSVPIRELGAGNLPVGSASSSLIRHGGKKVLLTVSHATCEGRWAVELQPEPPSGATLWQLGRMNYLATGDIGVPSLRDIDFAYTLIPEDVVPMHPFFCPESLDLLGCEPKLVMETAFEGEPVGEGRYGFFGLTRTRHEAGRLCSDSRLVTDMSYVEQRGDFFVFKLATNYEDDDDYRGCSGAPILGEDGQLVALVALGDRDEDCIYGTALRPLRVALDIECGLVR